MSTGRWGERRMSNRGTEDIQHDSVQATMSLPGQLWVMEMQQCSLIPWTTPRGEANRIAGSERTRQDLLENLHHGLLI